jgi:cytochrome c oxidase subunit 1
MYTYADGMGFNFWNFVATVGAFTLAFGILLFIINAIQSIRSPKAPLDPWDARTYEWMTTNPPLTENFASIPSVHGLDEFFHRKYEEDETTGSLTKVATAEEILAEQEAHRDEHIHMPSLSYWPLVVASGFPILGLGLIFNTLLAIVGAAIIVGGIFGWAIEPPTAPDEPDIGEHHDPTGGTEKELASVG